MSCLRRSGASENPAQSQQLRHEREHLTVNSHNLDTDTVRCQGTVSSLEAQVAQILRLRGMMKVERQKSNTQQADVLRLRAETVQISTSLDEDVAQFQAR